MSIVQYFFMCERTMLANDALLQFFFPSRLHPTLHTWTSISLPHSRALTLFDGWTDHVYPI